MVFLTVEARINSWKSEELAYLLLYTDSGVNCAETSAETQIFSGWNERYECPLTSQGGLSMVFLTLEARINSWTLAYLLLYKDSGVNFAEASAEI